MRALLGLLLLVPSVAFGQDADVAALRVQLRAAQDQIAADKATIAQLQTNQAGASAQDIAAAQQQNTQLRQNFLKLQAAANSTIKAVQSRDKAANDALSTRDNACAAANQKLFAAAEDILHLYETQSFRGILLKSYEPILGLDKVKLENIIQGYDDKIYDQQVAPPEPGAPSP